MSDNTPPIVAPDMIRGKAAPFAKLFETALGQILVTKDTGDDDEPILACRFDGACSLTLTSFFESEAKRDAGFDLFDQALAEQQAIHMRATTDRFGGEAA